MRPSRTVTLALLLVMLWPTRPAVADPTPAADDTQAVALAGGHLARLVTARGSVVGAEPVAERAWTLLGLRTAGVGSDAAARLRERLITDLDTLAPDGIQDDEVSMPDLALQTFALAVSGVDVRRVGATRTDLIATIQARQVLAGPDTGLYGRVAPGVAVPGHALALLALDAAGEEADAEALEWLEQQRCPRGGWPTYRDPASRSTGTCEVIPADVGSTSLAAQAQEIDGATARPDEVDRYLRDAADGTGAFGSAPGLEASPRATAQAILAIQAATGAPPDDSWAGSAGLPTQVLRTEMLGCGWHGRDRGGFPETMRDTAGDPMPGQPSPGATDLPSTTVQGLLALAGRTLGQLSVMIRAEGADALPGGPGDPFADCPVLRDRVAGNDRIMTALALSRTAFDDDVDTVVIAAADGYADALAGAALAGQLNAPLLLSDPAAITTGLREEIGRLGATSVVMLGGEAALSARVQTELAGIEGVSDVRRIAGSGRAETAALVAAEVGGERAFLARGFGDAGDAPWADALAVGAWSATAGIPVLLTDRDRLPAATIDALQGRTEVMVLGGTAAVSSAVETAVTDIVPEVTRIAGTTRYDTSAMVHVLGSLDGVDPSWTWIVTGQDFPDALAAGPAIAAAGGALLLVQPDQVSGGLAAEDAVQRFDYLIDAVHTIGGTAVVADDIGLALAGVSRREAAG